VPTILIMFGWRVFFYANERNEPIHVHCQKAECEAKYWVDVGNFDFIEAYSYNMSPRDKRTIRQILFNHFDYIVEQWDQFQGKRYE
jgi:uncharacterized protein DUF4160